jgi:UDP:flavonoid glycosyltransferase YjiC (YdhE family)
MPTIHVNISDQGECLAVVATLINQGYEVRIDIDEVFQQKLIRDFNAANGPSVAAARAKATEVRIDVDRIVENARAQRIMSKRLAREEDRVTDLGQQQAFYDARWAEAHAARDVECPSCGAKVGYPCTTPHGKAYGAFVHVDRLRAHSTAANVS